MTEGGAVWPTLAAFHADNPRRATSREVTFGSEWYASRDLPPWRGSWIQATREFIIVQLGGTMEAEHRPVELLGVVAIEPLEVGLRGWVGMCSWPGSLPWLRHRLAELLDP